MPSPKSGKSTIIDALNSALQNVLDDPDILNAWTTSGMAPYPPEQRTPAGAAAYLSQQIAHWGEVVRDNKIEAPAN